MKKTMILLPLIALTACASPRERCISSVNRPVITLDRLISETRGNVQRGYALREVQDVRVVNSVCDGRNADGTSFRFECEETQTRTRQEPVAIDIEQEVRKLAQLEERREQVARAAAAQRQQCIAANPE